MALREIRHYQSSALAEAAFIPRIRFTHLIKELIQDGIGLGGNHAFVPAGLGDNRSLYHIQRDALIALQIASEQLVTNLFEIWYTPYSIVLIISNLLAIHTKRVIIKAEDMQLLRDLWKRINSDYVIGADNADTRRTHEIADNIARRQVRSIVARLVEKIERLKRQRRLHTLTTGERILSRVHNLRVDG